MPFGRVLVHSLLDGNMIRLKSGRGFGRASPDLDTHISRICELENDLAANLLRVPVGMRVRLGDDAWFLLPEQADDAEMIVTLCHTIVIEGKEHLPSSRFDVDMDWDDVSGDQLLAYIDKLDAVLHDFDRLIGMPSNLTFDPAAQFDSVEQALALIQAQASPTEALMAVVRANLAMEENGFAADLIRDFKN